MNWESLVTLLVVTLVLYALARNLASPDVILLGGAVILTSLSSVSDRFPRPADLAAAFGNEGLITVGVLFVVAAGLTETGAIGLITDRFLGRPSSITAAHLRMTLPVAAVSAFLNNTPVVAMFMPVINDWSKKCGFSPSKLFIPLSYAAILGGVCTLIGTSTNLVVQGLMIQAQSVDPTMPTMSMFTITPVGVPVAIVGLSFVLLVSGKLLPDRKSVMASLVDPREYTVEMRVQQGGAIDGQTIEQAGLRHLPGMYLSAIERDGERLVAVGPDQRLHGNDVLEFVGIIDSVVDLKKIRGLVPATDQVNKLATSVHARRLVEAVVSNTSPLVGKSIREGRFRTRYNAAVIAVHRNGERIASKIGDIVARPGDTLLLEAPEGFVARHRHNRDFFLISEVSGSRPTRHARAPIALAILAGMVVMGAAENVTGITVLNAALIAAGLMGITRCCPGHVARRSIDLSTLIAIAAALAIGRAMQTTGLADLSASAMIASFQDSGPWGVLAGVYLITLIFTELVTNNAAAALAFPIAHSAARGLGSDFMPFAIVICIAASAGFATPLGYQTHMMVYGPGGYRFSDFVRIGLPLDVIVMIVAVLITPLFFPF
jgi:di/tricarboxylate transporter